jgi:hypothetical protein
MGKPPISAELHFVNSAALSMTTGRRGCFSQPASCFAHAGSNNHLALILVHDVISA